MLFSFENDPVWPWVYYLGLTNLHDKRTIFYMISSVFNHFQPCKYMHKHGLTVQNTQQTRLNKQLCTHTWLGISSHSPLRSIEHWSSALIFFTKRKLRAGLELTTSFEWDFKWKRRLPQIIDKGFPLIWRHF